MIIVDGTYRNMNSVHKGGIEKNLFARIRARPQTLFGRMKNFSILKNKFRHNLQKHADCIYAVKNLLELGIENGELLFEI